MKSSVIASTAVQTVWEYPAKARTFTTSFTKIARKGPLILSATDKTMSTYLKINDLHKTFYPHGQPLKVLEGIDLEIEKGEIF